MSKRRIRKILSFVVVVVLVIGNCMTAYAANSNLSSEDALIIYNDGETIVEGYEDSDGNMVFTQYVMGTLVQRNTVSPNNPEVIKREFFGSAVTRGLSSDTININDYGVLAKPTARAQAAAARTLAGTINYRTISGASYMYYGLRCEYVSSIIGPTTYTIRSYIGPVVDLVSILVGALNITISVVKKIVSDLLVGLAITVAGGVIKSAVSDTVSCVETDYTWTLTNTTASGHKKNVYGQKYYVTDVKSAFKGNTYYEGYTPNDWGTQALAVWFHNEVFPYSAFDVVSWS